MNSIVLEIPQEIAIQLKLPPKRAKRMLMEELVLRLYEDGIMTSGQGAALLQMPRLRFEEFLAQHEISIHSTPDDIEQDIENLKSVL